MYQVIDMSSVASLSISTLSVGGLVCRFASGGDVVGTGLNCSLLFHHVSEIDGPQKGRMLYDSEVRQQQQGGNRGEREDVRRLQKTCRASVYLSPLLRLVRFFCNSND